MAKFRSAAVTTTSTNIKTSGSTVAAVNIVNRHSAVVYVKFYDQAVATFQDIPVQTIAVQATASVKTSSDSLNGLFGTGTGLCVRATTDSGDSGNTAAATLPIIEVEYN
jgi:hypothetical protein